MVQHEATRRTMLQTSAPCCMRSTTAARRNAATRHVSTQCILLQPGAGAICCGQGGAGSTAYRNCRSVLDGQRRSSAARLSLGALARAHARVRAHTHATPTHARTRVRLRSYETNADAPVAHRWRIGLAGVGERQRVASRPALEVRCAQDGEAHPRVHTLAFTRTRSHAHARARTQVPDVLPRDGGRPRRSADGRAPALAHSAGRARAVLAMRVCS